MRGVRRYRRQREMPRVPQRLWQATLLVAGVSQKGRRLGRWLAWEEARTLVQAPDPHSIRGMRDRALLAVLVTCALRREELSRMNCEHLVMRDGRCVFLDLKGKG